MKNKIKGYLTKKRNVDKRVYLAVMVVYSVFGLQSVSETILEGSEAMLKDRFKTVVIVNEPVEVKKEIKKVNVTCNDWAEEFGGDNVDLIKKIIKAESNNNPKAKNGGSSASGCMQFINGTWNGQGLKFWGDEFYNKNVFSAKDNVELGSHLINKGELSRWNESKHNWSK